MAKVPTQSGVKEVNAKPRHSDFQTLTRSRMLDAPTDLSRPIYEAAVTLIGALVALLVLWSLANMMGRREGEKDEV